MKNLSERSVSESIVEAVINELQAYLDEREDRPWGNTEILYDQTISILKYQREHIKALEAQVEILKDERRSK